MASDELRKNLQELRSQLKEDLREAHERLLGELHRSPQQGPRHHLHDEPLKATCTGGSNGPVYDDMDVMMLASSCSVPQLSHKTSEVTSSPQATSIPSNKILKGVGWIDQAHLNQADPKKKNKTVRNMASAFGRTLAGFSVQLRTGNSNIDEAEDVVACRPVTRRLPDSADSVVPIGEFPMNRATASKRVRMEPEGLLRSQRVEAAGSGGSGRFEPELMSVQSDEETDEEFTASEGAPAVREGWAEEMHAKRGSACSMRSDRSNVARISSIVGRLQHQTTFVGLPATTEPTRAPPARLARVVGSTLFDTFFTMLIVVNSLTIGLQTDHMAKEVTMVIPRAYVILDKVFCVCFALELSMRLLAYGRHFFTETGLVWGIFDCCVVGLQVVEELLQTLATLTASDNSTGAGNVTFLRAVRILRLIRVLRIIRIIRFMDELRTLVVSIMNSMRSLFWTLMLLLLGIYVVGIYFTQLVLDFRLEGIEAVAASDTRLNTHFGRLPSAMLSLYQAMSGGIDWYDLSTPLITISTVQGIVFVLYIAFTVLALTNVVTGVFVEGALKSAKQEEEDVMLDTLRRMFWEDDGRAPNAHAGCLTKEQFKERLGNPQLARYLQSINVDPKEANMLFTLIDDDNSGMIDYEEWISGCMRIRGNARAIDTILLLHEVVQARRDLESLRLWVEEHSVYQVPARPKTMAALPGQGQRVGPVRSS